MSLETMTKLASVTVGVGGQASIAFTNIPQGYTDLQILLSVRSTGSYGSTDTMVDDILLTFNGSTAANYTSRRLSSDGSSTYSTTFTNQTVMNRFYISGSGATASTFGSTSIYVSNYAGSTLKSLSAESVGEHNATKSYMNILAGLWNDPSPITSTSFSLVNGNFAQHSTATLYGIKNARQTAGNSIKATGGNIVFDGTYVTHTFNSTGAFTPTQPLVADYLVVAGGGGGSNGNGGGGAGGFRTSIGGTALSLGLNQAYTVTVGAGGSAGLSGSVGSNSIFSTITSTGGGGGGRESFDTATTGGSGGGGGGAQVGKAGNSGGYSPSEGNAGGNGGGSTRFPGGGGGGAGGVGAIGQTAAVAPGAGGAGGVGIASNISGSLVTYAGGGGGGGDVGGVGGAGGGGAGGAAGASGTAGTANLGGGGGASNGGTGGAGGSGLVIIRYRG